MIKKHDLLLRGARSRLVELDKERFELIKMFPELETGPPPEREEPPVGASGRRLVKGGSTHKVWLYMVGHPGLVTVGLISQALHIPQKTAYSSLNQLVAQRLAVKFGRGSYKLKE